MPVIFALCPYLNIFNRFSNDGAALISHSEMLWGGITNETPQTAAYGRVTR